MGNQGSTEKQDSQPSSVLGYAFNSVKNVAKKVSETVVETVLVAAATMNNDHITGSLEVIDLLEEKEEVIANMLQTDPRGVEEYLENESMPLKQKYHCPGVRMGEAFSYFKRNFSNVPECVRAVERLESVISRVNIAVKEFEEKEQEIEAEKKSKREEERKEAEAKQAKLKEEQRVLEEKQKLLEEEHKKESNEKQKLAEEQRALEEQQKKLLEEKRRLEEEQKKQEEEERAEKERQQKEAEQQRLLAERLLWKIPFLVAENGQLVLKVASIQQELPTYKPFTLKLTGEKVLVTLLFDLSDSMRKSMKNSDAASSDASRAEAVADAIASLYAFQDSIYGDASQIYDEIHNVELLVYGFGFRTENEGDPKVRDLLRINDQSTSSTTPLSQLIENRQEYRNHFDNMKPQMFGDTPMKQALLTVRERVLEETENGKFSHVILFLVSDGEPTDCSGQYVLELTSLMRREGFSIISGFITDSDLLHSKSLVSAEHPSWSPTARTMFNAASHLPKMAILHEQLRKHGWQTEEDCRMFTQINQSQNLGEFLNTMMRQLITKDQ